MPLANMKRASEWDSHNTNVLPSVCMFMQFCTGKTLTLQEMSPSLVLWSITNAISSTGPLEPVGCFQLYHIMKMQGKRENN